MILTTQKLAEIETLLGFDFTQEGIEECHARHGLGCKACDAPTTEVGWFYLTGDVYCFACALGMDTELGTESEIIPTRAQVAQRLEFEAAGIRWD
jgi:hypothetical protein